MDALAPINGISLEQFADLDTRLTEPNVDAAKVVSAAGIPLQDWRAARAGWLARIADPKEGAALALAILPVRLASIERTYGKVEVAYEGYLAMLAFASLRGASAMYAEYKVEAHSFLALATRWNVELTSQPEKAAAFAAQLYEEIRRLELGGEPRGAIVSFTPAPPPPPSAQQDAPIQGTVAMPMYFAKAPAPSAPALSAESGEVAANAFARTMPKQEDSTAALASTGLALPPDAAAAANLAFAPTAIPDSVTAAVQPAGAYGAPMAGPGVSPAAAAIPLPGHYAPPAPMQVPNPAVPAYAQPSLDQHAAQAASAFAGAAAAGFNALGAGVNYLAGTFVVGARVLVTWSDGNRYPGTIAALGQGQHLIAMGDGQQHWIGVSYLAMA
jgi:hypothetical protein